MDNLNPREMSGNNNPEEPLMPVSEEELIHHSRGVRVTEAQLEAAIVSEHYFTGMAGAVGEHREERRDLPESLGLLTFCVLVLENGFTVTGQSACADPTNFNWEIGKRIARDDAKSKVWVLLRYELRTKLKMCDDALPPSLPSARTYVGTKVVHAVPMNRREYNEFRGWKMPEDENGNDPGYLVEYADYQESNVQGIAGYVTWSPASAFHESYELMAK